MVSEIFTNHRERLHEYLHLHVSRVDHGVSLGDSDGVRKL